MKINYKIIWQRVSLLFRGAVATRNLARFLGSRKMLPAFTHFHLPWRSRSK